jgi:hypothetical protein
MAFQHFARTGNPAFLDLAVAHADHVEDLHQCHFGPGNNKTGACRYCPPTNHVAWEQETVAHVEIHPSHHKTQSLFENYWLTGDPRALDVALEGCDWLFMFSFTLAVGQNIATYQRRISHLFHSLCYGYYQTGNVRYLNQLLLNWHYLQQSIHDNVTMGSDWQTGFLMEAMANVYYLLADMYADSSAQNHGLKDSVKLYAKVYADRKYGVSTSNAAIGYAFLSSHYGSNYLSQAVSKMNTFPPYDSYVIRDFAETGRSLEMAMYYFTRPESLVIAREGPAPAGNGRGEAVIGARPNPFNAAVKISWQYAVGNRQIEMAVYNCHGMLIKRLPIAHCQLPTEITRNPSGLPSGIYIIRLDTGTRKLEKKVALIR